MRDARSQAVPGCGGTAEEVAQDDPQGKGEAVTDYRFPLPVHVEQAEAILQDLEKRGYLDADWWAEAESLPAKDRPVNFVAHAIQAAVEAEREACAKVVDFETGCHLFKSSRETGHALGHAAAAIRARAGA
jgi:hypothetical protein